MERTIGLPFSPAEVPKPSSQARRSRRGARLRIRRASREGGLRSSSHRTAGAVDVHHCAGWGGWRFNPLSGPALFLEHSGANGLASVIASVTIPPGSPARRTSEVLEALVTRVLATCKDNARVSADPRGNDACEPRRRLWRSCRLATRSPDDRSRPSPATPSKPGRYGCCSARRSPE